MSELQARELPHQKSIRRQTTAKPPKRKPVKSRPPAGFREYVLQTPLPYYSGPYSVGTIDLEIPVRQPRTFSNISRDGEPLLKLETVLFSIFYPSKFGSGQGLSPEGKKKWSRHTWLPRPRMEVAGGYGKFAGIPEGVSAAWFGATTAFTKIPAFRNSKLAEHWPAEKNAREGGFETKNEAGEPPPGEGDMPVFPLLIFSHGLGGTRTTYSSVCGEFASYGFIVVSIEHRDGSGPRTFINHPEADPDLTEEKVNGKSTEGGKPYSTMDYIFPKNNAKDTQPGNPRGVDAELRAAQIQLRLAEIEEAYHIMTLIHSGNCSEMVKSNLRLKPRKGGSSRGISGVDFDTWKSRFHLQQVTMLGHSFGGATTIEVLRHKPNRFPYIGQGIIYDAWGSAIQPPKDSREHRITTPLLGINSEAFSYWPDNFEAIMTICKEVKGQDALVWLLTVRGSVHISQSDFSLLYPKISSLFLKMTINPQRAIDININASLEFLKLVMPKRISGMNRGTDEKLLEGRMLEKLPEEHKPEKEWTAMRLRVDHEWRLRLYPNWLKRYSKKKKGDVGVVHKDLNGKVLEGLEDFEEGEVWLHVIPTKEELRRHNVKMDNVMESDELGQTGEDQDGDGMVEVTGDEGNDREEPRGVEQMFMERG